MRINDLLSRVAPTHDPVFSGEWATLAFRPDLGSQQEFIVGVSLFVKGDDAPFVKWLPSFSKLSTLYGEAITTPDIVDLTSGSEAALLRSFSGALSTANTGTPHLRIVPCGFISTNNVERELFSLLKRHAGVLWAEPTSTKSAMNDDWAYALMRQSILSAQEGIFVPRRTIQWNSKELHVGLDNGHSFGNIVSARYSNQATVERHINNSLRQVIIAHKLTSREGQPALFVVLPESLSPVEQMISKKTSSILAEVEEMGVTQFANSKPEGLARSLELWANNVDQQSTEVPPSAPACEK